MAKPIKIWTGTEWIDVAVLAPSTSGLATTSALAFLESSASATYLRKDTASSTYLSASNANMIYLRRDSASATYLPISATATLSSGYAKSFLLGGM